MSTSLAISTSWPLDDPISDVAYFTPMRCDVRIEPIAGRYVSDSSDLSQLVGFLEVLGHRPDG